MPDEHIDLNCMCPLLGIMQRGMPMDLVECLECECMPSSCVWRPRPTRSWLNNLGLPVV